MGSGWEYLEVENRSFILEFYNGEGVWPVSHASISVAGTSWKVYFPFPPRLCPFPIDSVAKFALGNYSFTSVCLSCRNRISRLVVVYYLAVNCALKIIPSFSQYTLFVFRRLSFLLFFFSVLFCYPQR